MVEEEPIDEHVVERRQFGRGRDAWSRKLVAENVLTAADLIWPVFVHDEEGRAPVPSMPDAFRLSISALIDAAGEAAELGIPTIAVFPAVDPALNPRQHSPTARRGDGR